MNSLFSMPTSIREVDFQNKKVLLRVDFNVPFDTDSAEILDNTRITRVLPTIKFLISQGARVSIVSHLGRPKTVSDKKIYSFKRLLPYISPLFPDLEVSFLGDFSNTDQLNAQKSNELFLLENIRFYDGEEATRSADRLAFAKQISLGFDIYVNDAFSVCHRKHTSVTDIPKCLPHYMGFLLEEEINQLSLLRENIQGPYIAIVGGAKVSTKIQTLKSLLKRADSLLIGGAMAYTFLKSRALEIGNSPFERDYLSVAFQLIDQAAYLRKEILLPVDHLVARKIDEKMSVSTSKRNIPSGFLGGDIGPKTLKAYIKKVQSAKTIFWNGPMGVFEIPKFSKGTISLAKAVARAQAQTVVGGGDSVHALKVAGVAGEVNHVSGGGGASLEFLENPALLGIQALVAGES